MARLVVATLGRSFGTSFLTVCLCSAVAAGVVLRPLPARGEVYYYKDAAGGFHFSNVKQPGFALYIVAEPPQDTGTYDLAPFHGGALGRADLDALIEESAEAYDVEPALVKAVIHAESAFNSRAVSPRGARGLMQLMPKTARQHGCRNVYDAAQNIDAGVRHLRMLLDQYGTNLPRVLAAYNAGSESVDRYRGIPPYAETQAYVVRVLQLRRQYLRQQRLAKFAKR